MTDNYASQSHERKYTKRELRSLWTNFSEEKDAAERLAGFADCKESEAVSMIEQFKTAAARRAAEMEQKRKEEQDTAPAKMPTEAPETTTEENSKRRKPAFVPVPDSDPEITVDDADLFLLDSVFAAVSNLKHGYTQEIVADAMSKDNRKIVIIEKTRNDMGLPVFRCKTTVYSFHTSMKAALTAANKQNLKMRVYSDTE